MTGSSESALVEQPAIALLTELGWQTANCFHESYSLTGRDVPAERLYNLGRETPSEVVLVNRLRSAIVQTIAKNTTSAALAICCCRS
ncbi:MAG: hypothetical protein DKINENOH_05218 [bacterium]|nr:hypothetical protein [bacterium]